MTGPEAWSERHRALVVAARPVGYFLFAVLATSLPVMLVVTDVLIVLIGLGVLGTRPALPDPWQILLLAPLVGWFVTLLPPGIAGMGINAWICFVRSLQPRFRTRPIAIIKAPAARDLSALSAGSSPRSGDRGSRGVRRGCAARAPS
jgi:hypothetical protein